MQNLLGQEDAKSVRTGGCGTGARKEKKSV